MAAEAARVLGYAGSDYYGTAAPAQAPYVGPVTRPADIPAPWEQTRQRERAKVSAVQSVQGVSMFAVFGTVFAGFLMVFVVLAQISYTEIASETVRLNAQLSELAEQERRLEIEFERAIDMKYVERYARDALGMSRPDADQIAVIRSIPIDSAEIISSGEDVGSLNGFGSFISSLLEYFNS